MGRFSDTRELMRQAESMAPESAQSPRGSSTTIERLLEAVCLAPVEGPFDETMRWLLTAFSEVLPGYSLGLRIFSGVEHHPVVLRIPPSPSPIGSPFADDLVMFPELPHERVLPLLCRPAPSSLHCAAADPSLVSPSSAIGDILHRCAEATCAVIRHADRAHAAHHAAAEASRLRESLAQSDKLASLGQLSAGLVHDMSNPLTSIAVYADYLRKKMQSQRCEPDDVQRVQRIAEAADVLLGLTRALKSYARPSIEAPSAVSAMDVIDKALGFCGHALESASVEVQRRQDDDVPPVLGVSSELTQVFVNLITNACEALRPSGGMITIATAATPDRASVVVTVADSGPGIAAEHVPHVFEPFFTTRQDAGTGLGLSIVRHLIEKHRGSVSVQSTAGDGCTFTVVLPAATAVP